MTKENQMDRYVIDKPVAYCMVEEHQTLREAEKAWRLLVKLGHKARVMHYLPSGESVEVHCKRSGPLPK